MRCVACIEYDLVLEHIEGGYGFLEISKIQEMDRPKNLEIQLLKIYLDSSIVFIRVYLKRSDVSIVLGPPKIEHDISKKSLLRSGCSVACNK